MMSVESTPPPTPLIPRRLLDPMSATANTFQSMTINNNLPLTPPRSADGNGTNWPLSNGTMDNRNLNSLFSRAPDSLAKTNTAVTPTTTAANNLLTPTSMDRFITSHRRLSDSAFNSSTGEWLMSLNKMNSI